MLLDPLPLLQTVTPSRTPPLERDVLYGRPLSLFSNVFVRVQKRKHTHTLTYNFWIFFIDAQPSI